MIELAERPRSTWWGLIRLTPAACWWRLLAVEVLFGAADLAVLTFCTTLGGSGLWAASDTLRLAVSGLIAAWGWSAKLRILDGGHGILSALRPDPRRIGRLAAWLVALDVLGLLRLLIHIDIETYTAVVFSPAMAVVYLGSLYLAFAAALLPMVILLQGQGLRRAWGLSHGGRRTVLRVLPVVLLGALVIEVLEHWQAVVLSTSPQPPYFFLVQAAGLLVRVPLGTLTAVLLYVAFRLSSPVPAGVDGGRSRPTGAAAVPVPRDT
ncbi:hypothetical protein ACFC1R_02465 [Kitasatospora sp. NPDC056138]|uniref:hypothetical protein n=1 Tax=Kitasatospora sp. NPDC056138 TaxID=3345724 RepID=UPI0035DE2BAB